MKRTKAQGPRVTVAPALGALLLGLLWTTPAMGQTTDRASDDEVVNTASQAESKTEARGEKTSTAPAEDFELFPTEEATPRVVQVDEAFTRKVNLRRRMLSTHQLMGLTTLSLMIATTVAGTLNYRDIYTADGAGTGIYIWPHRILGYTTALSFATTGSLALFAPESYKRHKGFDTATDHKIAVSGATLGMLTQVALGFVAARTQEAGNPADMSRVARIHQISGFVTTGLLATAATVWIF